MCRARQLLPEQLARTPATKPPVPAPPLAVRFSSAPDPRSAAFAGMLGRMARGQLSKREYRAR